MKSSAFPYFGTNPRSEEPFLNISKGDRKGHRSYGGRVYWQDETYNDSRVLVHVPETFDVSKPGVIVVFFHGNGATLERDVRDRQLVPQQISDSGVNAVLLAPQLAVNAADSSAGKFWQPGGFKRFIDESASHLARLYGDPKSAQAFANLPIVIVGYSGGFLPTAWSLEVGGIPNRVRGVFLLDAVYGELDKFASWIEKNRTGFFVSSYTRYTKRRDQELMQMLRDKGITVTESMDGPLRPGSVVFVQTPDGVTHRDYVTQAWTEHPVKDVLVKMAATPALDPDRQRAVARAGKRLFAASHCLRRDRRLRQDHRHQRQRDKGRRDIARGVKEIARVQKAADRRSDRLPDIEHRGIERHRGGCERRRCADQPHLLHRIGGRKAQPPDRDGHRHQRIDAGAERPAGYAGQQQRREQHRGLPGAPGIDDAGCDRDADETAHAVEREHQPDRVRPRARQLRQQRPHEGEHHELAGHLQRRDQQQQHDHAGCGRHRSRS